MEHPVMHYFEVPDIPGRYFTCARYGTLSPESCARNFREAPQRLASGRLHACIGCRIGQQHAGVADSAGVSEPVRVSYRPVCVRCRRNGSEQTSRLLGRMRLIRGHTICVSCYNREREVLLGRNGKGSQPVKWRGLYKTAVSYVRNGGIVRNTALKTPVWDRVEVALTTMRQIGADSVFFTPPPIVRLTKEGI